MRDINSGNMNSARMATVTTVAFIVAFASVSCALPQIKEEPTTLDCSPDRKGKVETHVTKAGTTLALKCHTGDKVNPPFDSPKFQVCTDPTCSKAEVLSEYIPKATGTRTSGVTATVEIKDLPSEKKAFYVQCGLTGSDPCYMVVYVAPSEPVGGNGHLDGPGGAPGSAGGVTPGNPLSCAKGGGAITIKIPEKGSTAQFTCGNFTLYPLATDKVFAEDCKKEESLKDIVRSVKDKVYTLTADKKPPKKKWCYLCASSTVKSKDPGKASDYCLVHVESSSRTQSNSAIALAVMLPCVLAVLRTT